MTPIRYSVVYDGHNSTIRKNPNGKLTFTEAKRLLLDYLMKERDKLKKKITEVRSLNARDI